jgi:hypothetical protein
MKPMLNLSQHSDFIRAQDRLSLGLNLRYSTKLAKFLLFSPQGKCIGAYADPAEAQAAYLKACQDYEALRAFGECR